MSDWRKPTTWGQRYREALTLLCGEAPPEIAVVESLKRGSDGGELQGWAAEKCRLAWAQGIVVLDAAATLADTPAEGHQQNGTLIHAGKE